MLLPIHDRNPVLHIRFQVVTCLLIAACVLVFIWELTLPETQASELRLFRLSFVPARLFGLEDGSVQPDLVWGLGSIGSSLFLHSSFGHLFGNMLFLWVYGDNIEDATGHLKFILFYVLCGAAAALCQAAVNIHDVTPMVGASGAISGVLGAYVMLHPHARVLVMTFFFLTFRMRAMWLIGLWIAYQVALGVLDDGNSHIAWWAHVGGFAAGALLIVPFKRRGVQLFDRDVGEGRGHRQVVLARHQALQIGLIALIVGVPMTGFFMFDMLSLPLVLVLIGFSVYLLIQNLKSEAARDRDRRERAARREARRNSPGKPGRSVIPRVFGRGDD